MREQLLAAIKAWLDQVAAAQDPARALEPEALEEAHRLADMLRDDDGDIEARFALGWFHWYRCLALPEGSDSDALQEAIQALTPCFIAGVDELPEPLLPVLADQAAGTASAVLRQAMTTSDLILITTAVSVWQRILSATPDDHPNRAIRLSNLGAALRSRFDRTGAQTDLDEAINVGRAAVSATPDDHPNQAMYLSNLGLALRSRFDRTGAQTDLDEAINVGRAAVSATPDDHPNQAMRLSNLGAALRSRFDRTGAQTDLDEGISTYVHAVEVGSGAPSVRIRAARVAASLGAQTDARASAELLEKAVRLLPETASRRLRRGDQQYTLGGWCRTGS